MKLDTLNGNTSPAMKIEQDAASTEPQEANKDEDEELPDVVDDEEPADGKTKKKQTRKKRSLNWEEAERCLLLEVIKPKVDYVENRNVDAKSIKAKRLAWLQITKQFNALNFRHRSLEQIQVQWRSMKNTAKREYSSKHPKEPVLDGMELLDFMEEIQKEPISTRSQSRAPASASVTHHMLLKKQLELDIDEDTPLAALPTASGDESSTLLPTEESASVILPSPPASAESQNESLQMTPMIINNTNNGSTSSNNSGRKKPGPKAQQQQQPQAPYSSKPKRQRSQNSIQSLDLTSTTATTAPLTASITAAAAAVQLAAVAPTFDDGYKKELFELLKRTRLAELDFARRAHEQQLRHQQMEQEVKLNFYRQHEQLKLELLREEHDTRMHQAQLEHEERMKVYAARTCSTRAAPKTELHNNNMATGTNAVDNNNLTAMSN